MRTPQTLNGPVVAHPQVVEPVKNKVPSKDALPIAKNAQKPLGRSASTSTKKADAQVVALPVK
jgi:hypothetical protein